MWRLLACDHNLRPLLWLYLEDHSVAVGATDICRAPEVASLIEDETSRQNEGLELIASENFVSPAVLEAMGSSLTNVPKRDRSYSTRSPCSSTISACTREMLPPDRQRSVSLRLPIVNDGLSSGRIRRPRASVTMSRGSSGLNMGIVEQRVAPERGGIIC